MTPDDRPTSAQDIYSAEERREDALTFLGKKGAVELLCEVDQWEGSRFTDLKSMVPVSSSTLSKRLEEAVDCKILEIDIASSEYGTQKRYVFTTPGKQIRNKMQTQGLIRVYHEYQAYQKELKAQKGTLEEWIEEKYLTTPADRDPFMRE